MTTLFVLAGALAAFAILRTVAALGRNPEPLEAQSLRISLWLMAGSVFLLLSMVLDPFPLRIVLMVVSAGLTGRGAWLGRLLRSHRSSALLSAGAAALSTADRVESLEGRRRLVSRMPFRYRLLIMGSKVFLAWTTGRVAMMTPNSTSRWIFGSFAVATMGWLVTDVLEIRRRGRIRGALDREIDQALAQISVSPTTIDGTAS